MSNNQITWINRKIHPIPDIVVEMYVKYKDDIYLCAWKCYKEENYAHLAEEYRPVKGYLGTAEVIKGEYTGIGFHAWEQNDAEFVDYCITAICPIEIHEEGNLGGDL